MITFISIADDVIAQSPYVVPANEAAAVDLAKRLSPDGWCVTAVSRRGCDLEAIVEPKEALGSGMTLSDRQCHDGIWPDGDPPGLMHIVTITTFINHRTREMKHPCQSRDEVDRIAATLVNFPEVVKLTYCEVRLTGMGGNHVLFDRTCEAIDASNRAAIDSLFALSRALRGGGQ